MTEAELREIEKRAEAASEGPWQVGDNYGSFKEIIYGGGKGWAVCEMVGTVEEKGEKNLAFIAHSREDIPRLVAEVRRLQAVLEVNFQSSRRFKAGRSDGG